MIRRPAAVLAALAALLALSVLPSSSPKSAVRAQGSSCATGRQNVMTLSDPSAGDVDLSQLIGVHISALAAFPLPDDLPENARFDPYETTIYTTFGQLVKAQLAANGEIDLVLSDPDSDATVTVVIPDPAGCATAADPTVLKLIQQARQTFVQTLGSPASGGYTSLTGQAVVAGTGFINPADSGPGGSGTGIEIAPVLSLQLDHALVTGQPAAIAPTPPASSAAATATAIAAGARATPNRRPGR